MDYSTSDDAPPAGRLTERLRGALSRRARAWTRRVRPARHPSAAEAALGWLTDSPASPLACWSHPSPLAWRTSLAARGVQVALAYGHDDAARRWAAWLLAEPSSATRPARPLLDIRPRAGFAPQHTAAALRAVLSLADVGHAPPESAWPLAVELEQQISARQVLHGDLIPCAAALSLAARRAARSDWYEVAFHHVRGFLHEHPHWRWHASSSQLAAAAAALWEMGQSAEAARLLVRPSNEQRRDGAVAGDLSGTWIDLAALAQLASVWFRLGEHQRAASAMAWLARRQRTDGGFPGQSPSGRSPLGRSAARGWRLSASTATEPNVRRVACDRSGGYAGSLGAAGAALAAVAATAAETAIAFLDASLAEVEAAFGSGRAATGRQLATSDPRLHAAYEWLAQLPPIGRVADVGCGSGRYLRHLATRFPRLAWIGIDQSAERLLELPPAIEPRVGSVLRLPAADGEFDATLAAEVLEHSLWPQRAVDELCRVTRPGGRLLIIDKDRRAQPLSEHCPWERWFLAPEVCRWLAPHCDEVHVAPLPLDRPPARRGRAAGSSFLAWTAVRRRTAVRRAA